MDTAMEQFLASLEPSLAQPRIASAPSLHNASNEPVLPMGQPAFAMAGTPYQQYPQFQSYQQASRQSLGWLGNTTSGTSTSASTMNRINSPYHNQPYSRDPVQGGMSSGTMPARNNQYEQAWQSPVAHGVNGKRKRVDEEVTYSRTPPGPFQTSPYSHMPQTPLRAYLQTSPLAGLPHNPQYGHRATARGMVYEHDSEDVQSGVIQDRTNSTAEEQPSNMTQQHIQRTPTTPYPSADDVKNYTTPSSGVAENVPCSRIPDDFAAPPNPDLPVLARLAFEPDVYTFGKSHLFFMTIGDKVKAEARGYPTPVHVYKERMSRANIETTDINLAWVPSPTFGDGAFPWQPLCGTAAYIAAIKNDRPIKFAPDEVLYLHGKEVQPEEEIDIPMLHNHLQVLWSRENYSRTSYVPTRVKNDDRDDHMFFVPSQAEWTISNLPPSAAIMEPLKASKSKVENLVDKEGNVIIDAHGQPRRAFDHILPAHISSSVEGWLMASWLAEDPRLQWRDLEAHMSPRVDSSRLSDRYQKYRSTISAMTRDSQSGVKKRTPTRTDMKTIKNQSHERLVGNSWWHVDLAKELTCRDEMPMEALAKGLPAYPLPMRRKQNGEYSERVLEAQSLSARTEGSTRVDAELQKELTKRGQ